MDLPPVQIALDDAVSNSIRLWHEAEEEKRLRAQISETEARVMPAREKLRQWESLAAAFGRDGIPALNIENAVPGLERIANGILSEMTFGEHRLEFRTQRELKSKDALAETMDIIVTDWRGPRAYETFSGGERLRIDLAIRFALAELLANRSGNKVEWVVLDEGIGSQDEAHRNTVLEAIKRVSSRFALMLVITHIPEASASFPQQLRVERSGAGVEVLAS
jgi:exonuclease SbcC